MTAALIAELKPATFGPNDVATAHAAWTWAFRMDACAAASSLGRVSDEQLLDIALAADLFVALIGAERGRRRAALAAALLTPDAVAGGALTDAVLVHIGRSAEVVDLPRSAEVEPAEEASLVSDRGGVS